MAKFTKELEELQAKGIITPEVADSIRNYYDHPSSGANRMLIAFGIIGALLVGMGVVLIIAHNWDDLPTNAKLAVGFAPMLVTQVIAGFLIFKQSTAKAWTEATAVVLVFAVAVSISVVSQVYNISGDLAGFLLVWTLLTIPVIYLLRSWMASLLFWIGITWYASEVGFGILVRNAAPMYYWPLALSVIPFYIQLIRKSPESNAISFHNWFIAISLTIVMGLGDYIESELIVPCYLTLFSVFILIGQLPYFANRKLVSNSWLIGGSGGTIILLLILTFGWPNFTGRSESFWLSVPMMIWGFLFLIASALLYMVGRRIGFRNVLSKSYTFLIFVALFLIGMSQPLISRALANLLILALGVYTIREGALSDKLWKMNYGLLILSVLIMCRFFDTNMSFVIRGLLFVGIGVGFFAMNFYMVRKRKAI